MPRNPVNELKVQASLLIKALRSPQINLTQQALRRCQQYPGFTHFSQQQLEVACLGLKRKTALNIVALEHGWENWAALVKRYDTRWYPINSPFTLNWFSSYQEAKICQQEIAGFLLPYQNQFFVCNHHYIEWLGLDAQDDNWKKINFDAAHASHERALSQLTKKLKTAKNKTC